MLDLEKLRSDHYKQVYQLKIANRFEVLERVTEPQTPNELWQQLKDVTLNAAKETIRKTGSKHKSWISNDTIELITKKREAKQSHRLNTGNSEVKYKDHFEETSKPNWR